jgi:hypothetical protein
MKEKSWLKYFLIIMLMILVVFCVNYIFDRNTNIQRVINPVIISIVFYIIIGLLLGLEHVIQEIKKIGSWRINIAKLVLLGIPSLYFSFGVFIYFAIGKFLPNVFTYPIAKLISSKIEFLSVFQIILGYSIISSFYKKVDDIRK